MLGSLTLAAAGWEGCRSSWVRAGSSGSSHGWVTRRCRSGGCRGLAGQGRTQLDVLVDFRCQLSCVCSLQLVHQLACLQSLPLRASLPQSRGRQMAMQAHASPHPLLKPHSTHPCTHTHAHTVSFCARTVGADAWRCVMPNPPPPPPPPLPHPRLLLSPQDSEETICYAHDHPKDNIVKQHSLSSVPAPPGPNRDTCSCYQPCSQHPQACATVCLRISTWIVITSQCRNESSVLDPLPSPNTPPLGTGREPQHVSKIQLPPFRACSRLCHNLALSMSLPPALVLSRDEASLIYFGREQTMRQMRPPIFPCT